MDPADPQGSGGAMIRLESLAEDDWQVSWEEHLPFALWGGGVSDAGIVGGYAERRDEGKPSMWIGAFDSSGEELWSNETPITNGPSPDSRIPHVSAACMATEPARLLLRISGFGQGRGSGWRSFDLESGVIGRDFKPEGPPELKGGSYDYLERVVVLPGTRMLLGHWSYSSAMGAREERERGVAVTVMDFDGYLLWSKRWPDGHMRAESDRRRLTQIGAWVARFGLLAPPGTDGSFEVLDIVADEYERFAVVKESGRSEVVARGKRPADLALLRPPVRELEPVFRGRLRLASWRHNPKAQHDVWLRSSGRIYVQAERGGPVHVFGDEGQLLHELELPSSSELTFFDSRYQINSSLGGPAGSILIPARPSEAVSGVDHYAEFDADGTFQQSRALVDRTRQLDPGGRGTWVSRPYGGGIERLDAEGESLSTFRRNANGHWYRGHVQTALDSDGTLALRDGRQEGYQLIDGSGTPAGFVATPRIWTSGSMVMAGDWIVQREEPTSALVTRRSSGECFRIEAPGDFAKVGSGLGGPVPGRPLHFGLSPEGDELWIVCEETLELLRLALPE